MAGGDESAAAAQCSVQRMKIGLNRRLRDWSLRAGYRPRLFWEIWGRSFVNEKYQRGIYEQHRWLMERIRHIRPHAVLEVGCGFGRNLRFISESEGPAPEMLLGLELSSSMLRSAARTYGIPSHRLVRGDANRLPLRGGSFELVFTMGLLMHVPERSVQRTLSELVWVANPNLLIIEEWDENRRGRINEYTYIHDYPSHLEELRVRIVDRLVVTNRETLICLHGVVR